MPYGAYGTRSIGQGLWEMKSRSWKESDRVSLLESGVLRAEAFALTVRCCGSEDGGFVVGRIKVESKNATGEVSE